MCQKQVNTLMQLGVNVEATNNKTLLVCQKADLVIEYNVHRDCWFIRGDDGRKFFGFDEMLKKFKDHIECGDDYVARSNSRIS